MIILCSSKIIDKSVFVNKCKISAKAWQMFFLGGFAMLIVRVME